MNVVRLLLQAFIAAFITMIMVYIIKKLAVGKGIPVVSEIAETV